MRDIVISSAVRVIDPTTDPAFLEMWGGVPIPSVRLCEVVVRLDDNCCLSCSRFMSGNGIPSLEDLETDFNRDNTPHEWELRYSPDGGFR